MTILSKRDALIHRHTNIRGEQNDEDEKTENERKKMGPKRTLDEMMMMRKHKAKEQKEMKRQHFHLCIYDFL